MELKVKNINIESGGPLVAVLNEKDAMELGLHALDRVTIKKLNSKKHTIAVVDISDFGVKKGELGLFDEVMRDLKVRHNSKVDVVLAQKPRSIKFIQDKLDGKTLTAKEINYIINDVVNKRFSEVELTYFVAAVYINGFNFKETAALTKAIVDSGSKLKFKNKVIFDKHCAGGVANNRTTMIVVPILAALGYIIPKTSSRAITSPAGTSDTVEVLTPVSLSEKKIIEVVKKTNGCMVWGGAVNLAAADDILIKVRRPLRVDPEGMLLASILAKKKAVGATHVLIDLPYGYGAKFATKKEAKILGKKFIILAKLLGMNTKVVYTDGSQPIGNGVGPVLEVNDVLNVLKGNGPNDLREKSIYIATEMLKMIRVKNAKSKVLDILDSKKAYNKFLDIIVAQGGKRNIKLPKANFYFEVKAYKTGVVKNINNKYISKIARDAGAPKDKAAGIYLRVKKGYKVKKGEVLFTIYAENKPKLDAAIASLKDYKPFIIP
jgi:AMP phosphorylase